MSAEPMSCKQAASLGIERLRKPGWSNPMDHIKIDIVKGSLGPWLHVFSPINKSINGCDPVDVLWVMEPGSADAKEFVPYEGPLPDSHEYRTSVAA